MPKVFVENVELQIEEHTNDIDNTKKYLDGVVQTISTFQNEFSSSFYKYTDNKLIYLTYEISEREKLYNVVLYDKLTEEEKKLVTFSSSADIFVRRFSKNEFFALGLEMQNNCGRAVFSTISQCGSVNQCNVNFTQLNSVDYTTDSVIINCFEVVEDLKGKPEKLYSIVDYEYSGKHRATLVDDTVSVATDFICEMQQNVLLIKKKTKGIKEIKIVKEYKIEKKEEGAKDV